MKWWPLTGIANFFTEKKNYNFDNSVNNVFKHKIFKRSLHVFVIDVGNSNLLNFTIKALKAPQYNIHRFGIFFTETPRHADILIILGPLTDNMEAPLLETINQMPADFGTLIINEENIFENRISRLKIPNVIAEINKDISPEELLALLLKVQKEI